MFKQKASVKTDGEGKFETQEPIQAPTFLKLNVRIRARLLSPPETNISFRYNIGRHDGSTVNPTREFCATTGTDVDLGVWRIVPGRNVVFAAGSTRPPKSDTELCLEFLASIDV